MFRIVCDPSSGSIELCLNEIRSGSLMFFVCLVGVWQRNFWTSGVCVRYDELVSPSYRTHTPLQWCSVIFEPVHWFKNYDAKHRPSTRKTSVNHYEFHSSTALYSLMMDRIRSETSWSDF